MLETPRGSRKQKLRQVEYQQSLSRYHTDDDTTVPVSILNVVCRVGTTLTVR